MSRSERLDAGNGVDLLRSAPDGSVDRDGSASERPENRLAALFVLSLAAYVLILATSTLAESGLLKLLALIFAPSIFLLMAVNWLFLPRLSEPVVSFQLPLLVYCAGIAGSTVLNPGVEDAGDLLKLTLAPAFVSFGAIFEAHRKRTTWDNGMVRAALVFMVAVPLIVWGIQLATGATQLAARYVAGIFANLNNVGLYAVTLLCLFSILANRPITKGVVHFVVGAMFGTLGLLQATVLALLICVGRLRYVLLILALVAVLIGLYWLVPGFGTVTRLKPVVDSIALLLSNQINLATVTFGELVTRLGTTDLSFLFRLKHWLELWTLYQNGNVLNWFFGFGSGSAAELTTMRVVPHNDFIRYLFEFGLVTLMGFLWLLIAIFRSVGRGWFTVPLATVALYFVSENLINNFLAMVIFYFCAGTLAQRLSMEKRAGGGSEVTDSRLA
jgi:hypothetical protein